MNNSEFGSAHWEHNRFIVFFLIGFCSTSLDRWDFYKEYIETVVQLVKAKCKESASTVAIVDTNQANINFDSCHEFLCEVSSPS